MIMFSSVTAVAEMSLEQVFRYAIANHPAIEASEYAEQGKQQNEKVAQAAYYPTINAMALESTGFPGSAGATGVLGLMVSPFHSGPTAGIVLEQNIWDFGRTPSAVRLAEKETRLAKEDTALSGMKIGNVAQETYFLCSRDRSLAEDYSRITRESELIEKEVGNFVRVGQRSIVDKYISQSQTEQVRTLADDAKKSFELDQQKLAHLTGQKDSTPLCPLLEEAAVLAPDVPLPVDSSPLLSLFQARTEVSKARLRLFETDYNPRIVGMASAGWLSGTVLGIPKENYSAAIALILPLFEGFKTKSQVREGELRLLYHERLEDATRFGIREANLTFDRGIESARLRITHLKGEMKLAETGFQMAKQRYLDMQGTLIDLRESLRNLARTFSELRMALYELATQNTSKSLLNGRWNHVMQKLGS